MKITIELDPLAAFYLAWLTLNSESGKWQSPEDVISPLIREQFHKLYESKGREP